MPKKITLESATGAIRYLVDIRIVEPYLFRVTRIDASIRVELAGDLSELAALVELLDAARVAHSVAAVREQAQRQNPPRFHAIREKHPRAYTPWTPDDEATLERMIEERRSPSEIAQVLRRQPNAIHSRIAKLSRLSVGTPIQG